MPIEIKKGNVFLDSLPRPPTTMTSPVRGSPLFFFASPGERAGSTIHVDGSPTRQCQVLLPRSIVLSAAVREGCCAARHRLRVCTERANHAIKLSSSIRGFFVLTVLISLFSAQDTFVVRIFSLAMMLRRT